VKEDATSKKLPKALIIMMPRLIEAPVGDPESTSRMI
jgi:hypothetical protein